MLIDNLNQAPEEAADYHFADGDLSDFQSEFSQPKQDMGISEVPEDIDDEPMFDPDAEEVDQAALQRTARQTSKFVTHLVDSGAALALSLVSKNPVDDHKADKEDLKELERIFQEYFKETGGNIPLWLQLVICITTMYGFQLPAALKDRKLNAEREQLELERKRLERERITLERMRHEHEQLTTNTPSDEPTPSN